MDADPLSYKNIKKFIIKLIPKEEDQVLTNPKWVRLKKIAKVSPWVAILMIILSCLCTERVNLFQIFTFATSMVLIIYALIASWILKKLGRSPVAALISTLAIGIRAVGIVVMFSLFFWFIGVITTPSEEEILLRRKERELRNTDDKETFKRIQESWSKIDVSTSKDKKIDAIDSQTHKASTPDRSATVADPKEEAKAESSPSKKPIPEWI